MDFLVNEVPYDEKKTDSMVNMRIKDSQRILQESWWYEEKYLKMMGNAPDDIQNSKHLMKEVFGDQKICKNYTNRNWIWTFCDVDRNNVVYVLVSKTGLTWEFDRKSESYNRVIDVRLAVENYIYDRVNEIQT